MIIKTALCSFGMSGKVFHAPFIANNKNYQLYAVVERNKKQASEIYPEIKSYDSLEEMLQDDAIDLVVVNTPNYTHFDFAKKALAAGKHVVLEKPFVVDSTEGEELIALANETNKILSVFQSKRWDSEYQLVKQVVNEGALGDIVEAEFHYDRFRAELSPKAHKETPGLGAGLLWDLSPHLVDQALQLFGKPLSLFADIAAMRPVSKVDDYFELILYYSGKRVRLKASNLVKEPVPAYILHGTKGSFLKSRADMQEAALIAGHSPITEDWGIEPESEQGKLNTDKLTFLKAPKGNYMEFYNQMYNAIVNDAPVPVDANEALDVIKIIEAAFKSNEERRVVEIG